MPPRKCPAGAPLASTLKSGIKPSSIRGKVVVLHLNKGSFATRKQLTVSIWAVDAAHPWDEMLSRAACGSQID
jgi:hypothetical protein